MGASMAPPNIEALRLEVARVAHNWNLRDAQCNLSFFFLILLYVYLFERKIWYLSVGLAYIYILEQFFIALFFSLGRQDYAA